MLRVGATQRRPDGKFEVWVSVSMGGGRQQAQIFIIDPTETDAEKRMEIKGGGVWPDPVTYDEMLAFVEQEVAQYKPVPSTDAPAGAGPTDDPLSNP